MAYRIELLISDAPKSPNELRYKKWMVSSEHNKKWKRRVMAMALVTKPGPPPAPLQKAKVTCIRFSSSVMDKDNLYFSFKPCVDGLKAFGIIADDSPKHIDLICEQETSKRGNKYIKIIVEEVES